ncbi:hypothetical protein BJ741DRAFT_546795 [Chytriomyces cf. hyalinus JEL632]|nr:hypothetical protein BJ741DRAFT_546795 [Chytriomyces cf. hyalinus JEL632]
MASVLNTYSGSSNVPSVEQMLQRLSEEVEELRSELRSKSGALFLLKCENEALRLDHADLQKEKVQCVCQASKTTTPIQQPGEDTSMLSEPIKDLHPSDSETESHRNLLSVVVGHLEMSLHPDLSELTDLDSPEHTATAADDPEQQQQQQDLDHGICVYSSMLDSDSFSCSSGGGSSASAQAAHACRSRLDSNLDTLKSEPDLDPVRILVSLQKSADSKTRFPEDGVLLETRRLSVDRTSSNSSISSTEDAKKNQCSNGNTSLMIRKYTCSHCSKRFTRPSTLQTHMNSHTGHRPYKCLHCDMRFTVSSNMKRHMGHCHSK